LWCKGLKEYRYLKISNDDYAVVRNNIIDSQIAAATSSAYAKQVGRVAGGCELWESTDFLRMDCWGKATACSSMNCNCPAEFDKVQIRSRQDTIKNYASSNWYNLSSSFGYDDASPEICTFNPFSSL